MTFEQGELILYQSDDGQAAVDVRLKDETVWLSQAQMQELFDRERSVITKHINNIFKENEVDRNQVCAKFAHTAADGKTYQVVHYNLDVIISVGYRVKSRRGTQFRIWATTVLKDHLIKGYTLNRKRLTEKGIGEALQALSLLVNTLESHNLVSDEGRAVLGIIKRFARTWQLLWQYDENSLPLPGKKSEAYVLLELAGARKAIETLRRDLMARGEATDIFGNGRDDALAGIVGAIRQTFNGQDLYPTTLDKASNLLYLVIKDHPFIDGNKRIGSFLFLLFLEINGMLEAKHIDNKMLVALALLIATSDPRHKELMVKLIINLLMERTELSEG
jgi:prophage maintenance system killer protein